MMDSRFNLPEDRKKEKLVKLLGEFKEKDKENLIKQIMIEGYIMMGEINIALAETGIDEDYTDLLQYEYFLVECDEL